MQNLLKITEENGENYTNKNYWEDLFEDLRFAGYGQGSTLEWLPLLLLDALCKRKFVMGLQSVDEITPVNLYPART